MLHALQASGQTAFHLDYEDLGDLAVINGLARHLGAGGLAALDGALKKQNPAPVGDKVENPGEMEAAVAAAAQVDLARAQAFEPRRAAGIPSFLVAGPVLFMPVKGGPQARVERWLAGLGPVEAGLTHKGLRQWQRQARPHRSFTVLRHPLARAHAAFAGEVLTGRMPKVAEAFARAMKQRLPPPGTPLPAQDHAAAFLAFLRFARLNAAGQTAVRADAHLASQTAVLQGFAQHLPPDLVLREDRLAAGLAFLSAETGVRCPPPDEAPDPGVAMLAEIYDPALEAAAREAYGRDYAGFGFADWSP